MVELEQVVARRDYKLKPFFIKRCKCDNMLVLLRHNGSISQWCGRCKLIYPIKRECTYCGLKYDFDDLECKECEKIITELASFEVCVEDNERALRRLNRKHKRGEIPETIYINQKELCEKEIENCSKKAKEIRERRKTEKPLESQTQKQ
jgi:hypothetical protein